MQSMLQANWPAFVLVFAIGLLVAFWLFRHATAKPRVRERPRDVLDEGAAPARRNQALIDAPAAITEAGVPFAIPPEAGIGMAGLGEAIAMEVQHLAADQASTVEQASPGAPDDLTRIKGVGPKLSALLGSLGVTHYAQIAAWTDADLDRIDAQLGSFAGRPRRDNWIEQCRFLAAGDIAGYEGKFGKV